MMGQQPQQMVGIHHHHHLHHHESEQQPIVVDQQHKQHHHHHHQHHHQHQQLMEEESGQAGGGGGGEGLPEDEEDVEEDPEDDDPAELAAAVPSSGAIGEGMAPGNADAANLVPVLGVDSSRRQHQRPRGGGGSGGGGGGGGGGISSSSSGSGGAATAVVVAAAAAAAGLQMPVLPVPCCRVDGCGEDLSTAGDYHRRHKVCKLHATLPKVMNHGQEQRFCQQCSRFHSLSEFDEGKRSCRKRLAGHNERRRRHQPDSLATTSSESPPLTQGRESNKKPREWKGRGRGGRRGRSGLSFSARGPDDPSSPLVLRDEIQSMSSKRRAVKSGEESFSIIFNDAFPERDSVKGKMSLRVADMMEKRVAGEYKEIDELDIDIADMEQVKEGLDLGEGVVIPPLPLKRDGKLSVLKGWPPQEGAVLNPDEMQIETSLTPKDELENKRAWQRDDKETLLHCFWECSKVQPVWRWAARQLSKLRGSKVKLELRQAVFGGKLDSWASQENVSVWKLLRGIILWQIWLARKGKALSGIQWTSNKVIRAAWVDLMMYAMQDWLEVYKKKETGKMEDAHELRGKFDSKWLVNQFAGKRAEWSMVWKDPDDVLLD